MYLYKNNMSDLRAVRRS